MVNTDWIVKLIAFLHDPPDKMLALANHQRRAFEGMEKLIGSTEFQKLFGVSGTALTKKIFENTDPGKATKKADQVASAMDRLAFERSVNLTTADFLTTAQTNHPLSGRPHLLLQLAQSDLSMVAPALEQTFTETLNKSNTQQGRFLWLWRKFAEALKQHSSTGGVTSDWHLIPADTRIVDHTLWDHLGITAALATALPKPALLVCSVGPVQDFISTARRTQDLWMGSYILSYLTWRGMQIVADRFGPDTVVYPSLRGQPLVDHWLEKDHGLPGLLNPEKLRRATIPNKFVALLPASEAKATATDIEREIKQAWQELAAAVSGWLQREATVSVDSHWRQMFAEQQSQMPEVYWCVHQWPDVTSFAQSKDEADAALTEINHLLVPPPDRDFEKVYKVFSATAPNMMNVGTVYSQLHELAQRGFEARKGVRDFQPVEERGEKCTMCGVRAALRKQNQSARDHWKEVAELMRANVKGEYVSIKPGGSERLCSVCLIKRFVQRGYFEKKLELRGGFPSTSTIAAATFKAGVLKKLTEPKLEEALRAHLLAISKIGAHRFAGRTATALLPHLTRLRNRLNGHLRSLAMNFLRYDGDLFYTETFTKERLEKDYGLQVTSQQAEAAQKTARHLLDVCGDLEIDPPAKYFAVLMLDGDEMGKWLSGDKAPLFAQALHPEVVTHLRVNHSSWDTVLDAKRLLSPALHASISSALANYALHLVPLVIEQQFCGRLVYAGGDDVLALLPVDQALPAARALRAMFSGEVEFDASGEVVLKFRDPKQSGFVTLNDEPLLTMGPTATASVGVAIAHHLSPLDAALASARRAEKSAKKSYGRNALCVHFLKRSGEEVRVGAQWYYDNRPANSEDTVALFAELQQRFADKRISMKFASVVAAEARTLAALSAKAQERELWRLLKRQSGSALSSAQGEAQATELAPKLAQLAQSLKTHCSGTDPAPDDPQPGMVELAKWLALLRRLAQGGGSE